MKIVLIDSLTREERETLFNHDEISDKWTCETSERVWNTKLQKAGWTLTEEGRNTKGQWVYSVYEAPSFALSVRSAIKVKREMTEEQKQAARERMIALQNKRKQEM